MRVKRFSTLYPHIARNAISRGYKIVAISFWINSKYKHYFLEK